MPLRKLRTRLGRALPVLAILLLACAIGAAVAAANAMVETREVRIEVNAAFHPRDLPVKSFAPVQFSGFLDVSKPGGGQPPALRQIVLDFDRDGRLDVAGLPTCAPESVAQASVEEARRICKAAIVGTGKIEALVALPVSGNLVPTSSPLTLFNGPRLEGKPTVVVHARTTVPATQTYAFTVPIEKRPGEFRYRATADIPPLAGGLGAITKISVKIGREYTAGGKKRSYVSARCSDHILRSHGAFTFANGLTIEGVGLEKYCAQR
ncbi:MAG TPA: hypothetical protein VJL81_09160 [Solirubrobacterales bacterium]|nr:hypothetical protein [Solirubrobacterales bacterium]